ncbi:hypothetical protein BCR39DRAFT_502344 [Naematelia encephala]|uniref:FAD/NAD(P)-binding domain-containing protein n=1 Tax=Naematelia encephala TaxID=71784 RepID=A0A1Y2AFC8_9TREE|nr:hypothetical protein BCR39DRAFT_502344 [Naematelia encephala]
MSQYKNIVIIGASCAGSTVANKLVGEVPKSHRILLIDAFGFSFWPPASLRASVVPGWEDRIVAPLRTSTVFQADTQHQVIAPNRVVELRENVVILEKPFEGSRELPFFRCVLATGSIQHLPMRPTPGFTEAEYKSALRKAQEEVRLATKIVIVGGGPVGLEYSGEIRQRFPNKEITIVHPLEHVLNPPTTSQHTRTVGLTYSPPHTPVKFSKNLEGQLKSLNIKVILNEKVEIPTGGDTIPGEWDGKFGLQDGIKKVQLSSGRTIEADFVFLSVGNKAESSLVANIDEKALVNGMGEMIAVDQYLKVKSTNPILKKYYAIGDAAASKGWKTAQGAGMDGDGAAANILAEIRGKPLKVHVRPTIHGYIVTLGTKVGVGLLTLPLLGDTVMPWAMLKNMKGPALLVDDLFITRFKGSEKVTAAPIPA